jgi:hypothetical protein
MSRASTSYRGGIKKDVDGRDKPGHDYFKCRGAPQHVPALIGITANERGRQIALPPPVVWRE